MKNVWVIIEGEVYGDSEVHENRFYTSENKAEEVKRKLDEGNEHNVEKYPNSGTYYRVEKLSSDNPKLSRGGLPTL